MRIISDFKDYYDCMAAYDEDRTTMLIRNRTKERESENLNKDDGFYSDGSELSKYTDFNFSSCVDSYGGMDKYSIFVIGFAGKLFPCVFYNPWNYDSCERRRRIFIFDKDLALEKFTKNGYTSKYVRDFFDYFSKEDVAEKLFAKFGPIFRLEMGKSSNHVQVTRNVCLNDYGFYKVLPPPIAYNELYKFVCNMARPSMEIPEMPNEIRIHQAGFDPKTSFRREKSKK